MKLLIKYLKILLIFTLLMLLGTFVLLSLYSLKTDRLVSHPNPSSSYGESLARVEHLQQTDTKDLAPSGRSILMTHGQKTAKVVVFFHGFTSSPRQFKPLGELFFKQGYNVYIPRMPHHGRQDQMQANLESLSAEKLVATADQAVDIAQGLGEKVTVVGLSMGGVMSGWVAQQRADVERAVIMAPNFGTYRISNFLLKQSTNALLALPNYFIWWDRESKFNLSRPTGSYQGFASHGLAQIRRLGYSVQKQSKKQAPQAKSILIITNNNDHAVKNENINALLKYWRKKHQAIATHIFKKDMSLGHDFIDVEQPHQQVDIVYPKLLELILGNP